MIGVLIARNKEIKREDLVSTGLDGDSIGRVERHLFSYRDFKRWCDRYGQAPVPINGMPHKNGHVHPPTATDLPL